MIRETKQVKSLISSNITKDILNHAKKNRKEKKFYNYFPKINPEKLSYGYLTEIIQRTKQPVKY